MRSINAYSLKRDIYLCLGLKLNIRKYTFMIFDFPV